MGACLLAPFQLVITTTGILRLFTLSSLVVAFFVLLSSCCYKFLEIFSRWLSGEFAEHITTSWMQFIGYVLNFPLLYDLFIFYYSVFCLFVVSFIVTYSLELSSRIVPEFIDIFKQLLKTLTGGN